MWLVTRASRARSRVQIAKHIRCKLPKAKDTVYFRETRSRTPCALSAARQVLWDLELQLISNRGVDGWVLDPYSNSEFEMEKCMPSVDPGARRDGQGRSTNGFACLLNYVALTVYKIDHSAVDGNPEVGFKCLKKLVGERGFEPPTPWSRSNHRNTILLIRLAWFCVLDHGFNWFSAVTGPKLDPSSSQLSRTSK
jgi:hypothetical protein